MAKDRVFELSDIVRETGFAMHKYFGPGHLEKVYENSLFNRLKKQGIKVAQQQSITVTDEDNTKFYIKKYAMSKWQGDDSSKL